MNGAEGGTVKSIPFRTVIFSYYLSQNEAAGFFSQFEVQW